MASVSEARASFLRTMRQDIERFYRFVVAEWLSALFNTPVAAASLGGTSLLNGVILCSSVQAAGFPELVRGFHRHAVVGSPHATENLRIFVGALHSLGANAPLLKKGEELLPILMSLLDVARSGPAFKRPRLLQLEHALCERGDVPAIAPEVLARAAEQAAQRLGLSQPPVIRALTPGSGIVTVDDGGAMAAAFTHEYLVLLHGGTWNTLEHYLFTRPNPPSTSAPAPAAPAVDAPVPAPAHVPALSSGPVAAVHPRDVAGLSNVVVTGNAGPRVAPGPANTDSSAHIAKTEASQTTVQPIPANPPASAPNSSAAQASTTTITATSTTTTTTAAATTAPTTRDDALKRKMAALETAQAWAAADHAAAERVLQDQLDAANVREKNLTEKKLQLETALRAAMIEADELRRALARQAAPSDAVNQSSTRAVDIPANNNTNTTINTVTTSSTSNTIQAPVDETSLHEKCEAQRAVLVHTIAAQEDQIAMWGQRHAITVAEYEETIANLSARAVGVALALDTARDSQSRSARLGLVGTQVALDELQAKLTREHAEDLTALRASERAALEARDAAQAELARVKDDMAAEKARTAAERDATVARLEQEVRRLQTALDTGASQWHGDVTTMRSAFEADVRSRDMVVGQEKARLESQLARTEEHYRSQLQAAEREAAAVAARHNAQLADVRQLHRTEMAALEQRLRAAEDRGKAQARAQDEALQRARESFEERLREVTQRHRSEAAVLAEQHQSVRTQLEQAQAQHSRQIAGVSATATSETATRQALQRENDQYQSALGVAQQRIAALESALRDEKEARRRESEQLRATNEHLQDELYAAQGDREGLEAELQQLRAHFAQLEDSIHRLSEREQRLDEEHTEAMRRLAEQERAFQDKIRALQARSETRSDSAILAPLAVPVFTSNHVTNSSTNSSSVLNHSTSSGTVTSESTRNLSFHAATGASRADTGLDHLRGPFVQHHGASSLWSSTVKH